MIRDLYDNRIVAYKTAISQTVSLVLDTIRLAMRKEKKEGRREPTTPQRPRLSIYLASIFQANTKVQHNAVNVKERELL